MRHFRIALISGYCAVCMARDLSMPPAVIAGTRVDTEVAARHLAFDNYLKQLNGKISATDGVSEIEVLDLGFEVSGFATNGAKIWEARVTDIDVLKAIIWINPHSEQIHFVYSSREAKSSKPSGQTNQANLLYSGQLPRVGDLVKSTTLEIKGAKVPNAVEAQKMAFKAYAEKLKLNISTNEAPSAVSVLTMGYKISDFGNTGDKVWEVRITNMGGDTKRSLRAIIWINALTEKVHFVIGPW